MTPAWEKETARVSGCSNCGTALGAGPANGDGPSAAPDPQDDGGERRFVSVETRMVEPDEELLAAAEDATRTLLRFAGVDADAEARSGGERVEVDIEGTDASPKGSFPTFSLIIFLPNSTR